MRRQAKEEQGVGLFWVEGTTCAKALDKCGGRKQNLDSLGPYRPSKLFELCLVGNGKA